MDEVLIDNPNTVFLTTPVPVKKQSGLIVRNVRGQPGQLIITDVSNTDLPGTVIYDEFTTFSIGSFSPADPTNGDFISGTVQSRVTKSTSTGTLIFSYRFRDLTLKPLDPQDNFIELVALDGYQGFFPLEVFWMHPSQSMGPETMSEINEVTATGKLEFAAHVDKPGGTTFVDILTTATKYKTGKYMDISNTKFKLAQPDKIAVPDK